MKIIWLTDSATGAKIGINPEYVVAVFIAMTGEVMGKTVVSLTNGSITVTETDIEVAGMLQGN